MTIALRKLALLEKNLEQREEEARIRGFTTSPFDSDLKKKITQIMDKVKMA